jgi:surface antigen
MRVVASPMAKKAASYKPHTKRIQAAVMILFYFAAFAFFFQTSRAEFEEKSMSYVTDSQSVRKTSTNEKTKNKPTTNSSATSLTLPQAPKPQTTAETQAEAGLPPYNEENESAPSTAQQYTSRGYAYGHCTYYVASRRPIPQNWGNAREWLSRAKTAGYLTGVNASPGAIAQTTTGRWGHVAYVEKVEAGKVYLSEYNFVGWNRLSYRWANENEFKYIY